MLRSSRVEAVSLEAAKQYRLKAQNYRTLAALETDPSRREAFELLAATLERLASVYERPTPLG